MTEERRVPREESIEHVETIVVGGGKGGKTLATKLAASGRSVVLVERGMIGGSCINVACIPTKTLVHSAKLTHDAAQAERVGVAARALATDLPAVVGRRDAVVAEMVGRNRAAFAASGMTFLLGEATFVGPRTVEVTLESGAKRLLRGDEVFVNTGTRPFSPTVPGLETAGALDSESAQRLSVVPERLLVLGGGYIGTELAQVFRRLGSQVTLVERAEGFLPREDRDVAEALLAILRDEGIEILLGAEARRVDGRSGDRVTLHLSTKEGDRSVEGTHLLVALGRTPNTDGLGLDRAGVEVDARGFVKVNDALETTAEGVWALGDVNGGPQFTHVSLDDFRIVWARRTGGKRSRAGRVVPYTLFTDPELGRVGMTEAEARAKGLSVRVATLPVSAIPRAVTSGETRGLYKAVVDATTGRILGAAILGPQGGEVIAVLQMAMAGGLTAEDLRDTIFSHPTMAEALNDLFARLS